MTRRSWALKVVNDCAVMEKSAQQRHSEIEVITRAVDAAVMNLERHVKALDQKNADVQAWSADMQKEQIMAGTDWEASIARLRSFPANADVIKFITGHDPRTSPGKPTLEDLIDSEEVKRAGKLVRNISTQLSQSSAELGTKVDEVLKRTDDLFDKVERSPARSAIRRSTEPAQLMQDIEVIARRVSSDYESVLGYANTAKSISQASKSALLHTKNFLPNLTKRGLEMDELLRSVTEIRNLVAADSLDVMHDIANLTAMLSETTNRFASINLSGDGFDAFHLLSTLKSLPVTYASFVAEAIRRREWNEKVRSDSSTLANEMAAFQDEEARRRRRWQKNYGNALWGERVERKVMCLEVNVHGEEEEWPQASRQDLEDLLEILRSHDAKSTAVADVSKILSELNTPTKQQSKRAKAFKNGSIHEAALGRSALLLRGDDDLIRTIQDEKAKVESKLKTAESRVRRLEDLLHRQTHVNRTPTGTVFQLPGNSSPDQQISANPLASPRLNDDLSRRSSVSSRRFSANQGLDEKAFQQKVLSLEAELIAERERASAMEKEISAKNKSVNNMKSQVDEALSMRRDLMENFEAQQHEFIEERRSLENEIKRLKAKLEELEDEMDRYLGSRENERMTVDDRVRSLQEDLDQLRKEATLDAQKAQSQVEHFRNDAKLQHDNSEALDRQLQKLRDENKALLARVEFAELSSDQHRTALRDIYSQISVGFPFPDELNSLREALVSSCGDLIAELQSLKSDIVIARSDRDRAQTSLIGLRSEMAEMQEKISTQEIKSFQLQEALAAEQARFAALEAELTDDRAQLTILRTKIADSETGSEALRNRLEEEERKVASMLEELAARQSRIGGLEEESRFYHEKYQSTLLKHDKLIRRFDSRTGRAKDLTQRLYAQNDRLCRLLERLSYSVTREGSSMVIQRLPKPDRSTANIGNESSDPGSTIKRSISGAVPRTAMVDSGDLELLYWMHSDDSETESEKYDAYLNAVGGFDVEAFCEVITKRVKDMEYIAKKYSKDARAYREKSHVAQKEAHEKIAFKNFKEGDLALFLPTRNQAAGAWAAFNVGAPHYFLREQDSHKLRSRDWLLARIHKIEDRVVDLSKSMSSTHPNAYDGRSFGETSNGADSFEDDNPFELSDGLRWYLVDAAEEKPGAPSTPGLAKSTVAGSNEIATGTIERRKMKSSSEEVKGLNKTLSKSLDSRRSSSNSKRAVPAVSPVIGDATTPVEGETGAQMIRTETAERGPEVRNAHIDELMGP
jgi:autophagy-related protein 11